MKKTMSVMLVLAMLLSLCACSAENGAETQPKETGAVTTQTETQPAPAEVTVTDMIGREVTVTPGSYTRVVCIGAGALRMYSYIGDAALLAGVEDIDNTSLTERPAMFDSVARPYVLAYGETFKTLPSCGVGGPMAQTAEAEKILSCDPDIVISEFEDVEKSDALQAQLGVPVVTLSTGSGGVFDEKFSGSMELLGRIFGKEEKAESLVRFVEEQTAAIRERVAQIPEEEKPGVYICGLGIQGVGPLEEEKFVELGAGMDIIIMDAAAVKNIQPLYAEDPTLFDTCAAWQTGEVYLEMAYNAYYTNFEIALINTWFIAKTVYPEAFADIDMTAKTNEVTKAFLGMELAEQIFACPGSFGGYQKIDTGSFFG